MNEVEKTKGLNATQKNSRTKSDTVLSAIIPHSHINMQIILCDKKIVLLERKKRGREKHRRPMSNFFF